MRKPIIAVDFDGTIVENKFPGIGEFRLNAVEALKDLAKDCTLILWTCRNGKDLYDAFWLCKTNGIEFSQINKNVSSVSFSPYPKIFYDIIVDDRQVGGIPEDWWEINRQIRARLSEMEYMET